MAISNKELKSTYATGGGGYYFENKIQAMFLLFVVLGHPAPIIKLPIDKVCFQTQRCGINTDDLLVVARDNQARLLCQMKHDLVVSSKDKTFLKVIKDAWRDFKNSNFNIKTDKIALFTGYIAKVSVDSLRELHELALSSASAEHFIFTLSQTNLVSKATRQKLSELKAALEKANNSTEVSDEDLWNFCRIFILFVFDLDFRSSINKELLEAIISCNIKQDISFVWEKLICFAQECDQMPTEITISNFDLGLLRLFKKYDVVGQKADKDDSTLPKFTSDSISNHVEKEQFLDADDFVAKLVLLGSWDASNNEDRSLIEDFFGMQFNEFQKKIQSFLAHKVPYISKSNKVLKINDRETLFKVCEGYYTDDDIDKMFCYAKKVIFFREANAKENKNISGKIRTKNTCEQQYSDALCKALADGLCLIANNPPMYCTEKTLDDNKFYFIQALFDKCNKERIIGLNELLMTFAEVYPTVYLTQLEQFITNNPSIIEGLFPAKNDYFSNSGICYILWSIEALAWDSETFIKSIRCLAELESLSYDCGNFSNVPINSLVHILLPWFPQTLASENLQRAAITSLSKEYPDVAWKLIRKILPGETSTSINIAKPKFLHLVFPDKNEVSTAQYWGMCNFCYHQAIHIADSDPIRISSLIKYLYNFSSNTVETFLNMLMPLGCQWDDKAKFHSWLELMSLKFRIEKYQENVPADLMQLLFKTIDLMTPQNIFYKNQRLFHSRFDEYVASKDHVTAYEAKIAQKEDAVYEIYTKYGLTGVYDFGQAVGKPFEVYSCFGRRASADTVQNMLKQFAKNEKMEEFIWPVVQSFTYKNGYEALLTIGLEEFDNKLILGILSKFAYCDDLYSALLKLIPGEENRYWAIATLPGVYRNGCGFEIGFLVEKLIAAQRYVALLNILGNSPPIPTIEAETVYFVLEKSASRDSGNDRIDAYAVQRLIAHLQELSSPDIDRLSMIEWAYLNVLGEHSSAHPRALKYRIANSPDFFCSLAKMMYRKHHSELAEKDERLEEGISTRLFEIFFKFDIIPGTDWDGDLHEDVFNAWISYVLKWSIDNDRETVVKHVIGNGLSYLKISKESLPCKVVMELLDGKEHQEIRSGYRIGIFNQRGVHIVDPEGKEEKALAAKYTAIADAVRDKGYSRFAETLIEVADSYIKEYKRNAKEFVDDD